MYLQKNFLYELANTMLRNKGVMETIVEHLEYSYIPVELKYVRLIFKHSILYYKNEGKIITYGQLSQQFSDNTDALEEIDNIKESKIEDVEQILSELEKFIKQVRFILMNEKVAELYEDERKDEAVNYNIEEATSIVNFSIRKSNKFSNVFADFPDIIKENREKEDRGENIKTKIPFGIDFLDMTTYGGIDSGETAIWLMRSGVGKSTALKWTGMHAASLGYNVLHFQLEGTKEECTNKYTQLWTASMYNNIRKGDMDKKVYDKCLNIALKNKVLGRDVSIYAFEQFDECSMRDIRDITYEYRKISGKFPDLILIDYLSLVHPGDGIRYGVDTQSVKMKKENTGKKMKNLSLETGSSILTADQVDGVSPDKWDDPNFVFTRYNVPGAKGLADSFSYFITGNQTNAERKQNIIRVHLDKLRYYKIPDPATSKIVTDYDRGRFYSRKKTKELGEE